MNTFQQFFQHALDCVDPSCILPICVNMKLKLKHSQICHQKTSCALCKEMKSLASQHSQQCKDFYCCVPFCMEAKLEMFKQDYLVDLDDGIDFLSQEKNSGCGQKTDKENTISATNSAGTFLQANSPSLQGTASSYPPPLRHLSPSQNRLPRTLPSYNDAVMQMPQSVVETDFIDNLPFFSNHAQSAGNHQATAPRTINRARSQSQDPPDNLPCEQRSPTTNPQDPLTSTSSFAEKHVLSEATEIDLVITNANDVSFQPEKIELERDVGHSLSQKVADTSKYAQGANYLSMDSFSGGDIVNAKSNINLCDLRLMDASYGIMRHVINTKTRRELLMNFGLLRSALRVMKRLNSSSEQ
ncbi:uncharacterized protein [Montipora foliosa]|uniref:uncharacterized protein n=1 Tax=Montipora foliosa TaxID=591990 RepID=UPI0035F1ABE1